MRKGRVTNVPYVMRPREKQSDIKIHKIQFRPARINES